MERYSLENTRLRLIEIVNAVIGMTFPGAATIHTMAGNAVEEIDEVVAAFERRQHPDGYIEMVHPSNPGTRIVGMAFEKNCPRTYELAAIWEANEPLPSFQMRLADWMQRCFGPRIAADKVERNYRFLEEALELVQSCGCTQDDAHKLVDYVYGRPEGDVKQEVGGVMVTLAALCRANDVDMHRAGEREVDRINDPLVMQKIRHKQTNKPQRSPLPEDKPNFWHDGADADVGEGAA